MVWTNRNAEFNHGWSRGSTQNEPPAEKKLVDPIPAFGARQRKEGRDSRRRGLAHKMPGPVLSSAPAWRMSTRLFSAARRHTSALLLESSNIRSNFVQTHGQFQFRRALTSAAGNCKYPPKPSPPSLTLLRSSD